MNNKYIISKCSKPAFIKYRHIVNAGIYNGYPNCCIINFINKGGLSGIKNNKYKSKYLKSAFNETGFIPCSKCLSLDESLLIKQINENRLFCIPKFPVPINHHDEMYYYLFNSQHVRTNNVPTVVLTMMFDNNYYRNKIMTTDMYLRLLATRSVNFISTKYNETLFTAQGYDYIYDFIKQFIEIRLSFDSFGAKELIDGVSKQN